MKNEFAKFALCKFAFVIYGCKKHEYKIKFSYFYENFNAMYKQTRVTLHSMSFEI